MNWNQEELEQWALAARQKEEDNLTLEKYRRADEAKIKELTLQIEKPTSWSRKLQRHRPHKSNLTRQLKSSSVFIKSVTSCTFSGKTLLRTIAVVTS